MRFLFSAACIAALGCAGCEQIWKGQLVPCNEKSGGCPAGYDSDLGTFTGADMADSNADFGPTGPPDLAGPQPLDYYSIGRLPSNGDLWVGSTDSRIVPLLAGNSYAPGTPVKLNNFGEYLLGIDINQYSQVMITSIQGRIFLANTGMPDMSTTIYKDDAGASLNALSLFSFNNSPRGWAVGSMGRSARYDYTMSKWVVGSTGVSSNLHAVQYCGQTYTQTPEVIALAVGADGTILRGGVDTLNTKETNTNTATLFGVTCSMGSTMIGLDEAGMASQQVAAFAVGASGTILRRSVMAAWSKENSTAIPNVNFRAAQSAKFVSTSDYSSYYTWVVGDKGTVMYWDGFDWRNRSTPLANNATLRALLVQSDQDVIVVGDNQTVLRYYSGTWTKL